MHVLNHDIVHVHVPTPVLTTVVVNPYIVAAAALRMYHDIVHVLLYHQFLPLVVVNQYSCRDGHVFTNVGCLASWWFSYPTFPLVI